MNYSFPKVLQAQCALHPSLTPQDALKLCFQACFGAEHLLNDPIGAQHYFEAEFQAASPEAFPSEPLVEQISPDVCRINLRAWKQKGLPSLWLFRLFLESANTNAGIATVATTTPSGAPAPRFAQNLADIAAACATGQLPFSPAQWANARSTYLAQGVRAVHHSDAYRTAEQPAYRLVCTRFLPLLPLLQHLATLPTPPQGCAHTIAIDGRCGGGKSTLAAALCAVLQTDVIAMDDFFLPPEKRTPTRLAAPGGNVDYERFSAEVLPHLGSSVPFAYRPFICRKMAIEGTKQISENPWHVVEGSYSHHSAFGSYATLRVFVTIAPNAQITRIRKRNGDAWAADFTNKWIPMEEAYFSACETMQYADIILETTDV